MKHTHTHTQMLDLRKSLLGNYNMFVALYLSEGVCECVCLNEVCVQALVCVNSHKAES